MAKRFPLSGWFGVILVAGIITMAVVSLFYTPHDPLHAVPGERLLGPSADHLAGTDRFGRDVFSQLMVGARITLMVGVVSVGIGMGIGTPLGIVAGMRGGLADTVVMRISDVLLALPALLMAIVTGAIFGASTLSAMVAIGIAGIPGFARVARAGTKQLMSRDFISSARMSGIKGVRLATRHVIPNILGLVIVQASVAFALAILAEAALSFLGLGTPPPDPSWGRMLQAAQSSLGSAPMLAVWPGAAIACAVLGFNLLGDGLRDFLDPKHKERR